MFKLFAFLFFLFPVFFGNASSINGEFYKALSNFTYVSDYKDEHTKYTTHLMPFKGDCEDFAFTLQGAVGGEVWVVEHDETTNHAVLVRNGIVYDNYYRIPIKKENFPKRFIGKLMFNGETIFNGVYFPFEEVKQGKYKGKFKSRNGYIFTRKQIIAYYSYKQIASKEGGPL